MLRIQKVHKKIKKLKIKSQNCGKNFIHNMAIPDEE